MHSQYIHLVIYNLYKSKKKSIQTPLIGKNVYLSVHELMIYTEINILTKIIIKLSKKKTIYSILDPYFLYIFLYVYDHKI